MHLFVCKVNRGFVKNTNSKLKSGLANGVNILISALKKAQINAEIAAVENVDEMIAIIEKKKPKTVFFQAIWLGPHALKIMSQKFPGTQFINHIHSDIPFLAGDSHAINFMNQYVKHGCKIAVNDIDCYNALESLYGDDIIFLPNVYMKEFFDPKVVDLSKTDTIKIGCFGAIRPMKNHLLQAIASIRFAKKIGKRLEFYINATRPEFGGEPVLSNLISLFQPERDCELIKNKWIPPENLLEELNKLHIGTQVSMTETFNIMAADKLTAGLPVLGSYHIPFLRKESVIHSITSVDAIVEGMESIYQDKDLIYKNQAMLKKYSEKSLDYWLTYLNKLVTNN